MAVSSIRGAAGAAGSAGATPTKAELEKAFSAAMKKGVKPLVQDEQTLPSNLKLPASVKKEWQQQSPILMDGHLSLYKLPVAGHSVYVVSAQADDGTAPDNSYFTTSGKQIG